MFTITLRDGTILENLEESAGNFISSEEITADVFEDNLQSITISDGENEENCEDMALVYLREQDGKYWFRLRELARQEKTDMKISADIEYIAMMTDVDLEEV